MNSAERRTWKIRMGCAVLLLLAGGATLAAQASRQAAELPDGPKPQVQNEQPLPKAGKTPQLTNCDLRNAAATMAATASLRADQVTEAEDTAALTSPRILGVTLCVPHMPPMINWYARFLNGPQVKALTPLEKAHLAGRNLVDPFNLLTIGGEGVIAVGLNSHSPDGPGMRGYANYVGVSFTQDLVGEFFGTFLIPSVAHQDPHYHRLPGASIKRRVFHCLYQIAWTQGDSGRGMVNYADLVGFAIEDEVNNLYVPGQQTDLRASAARYGIGLSLAPVDNFITEFLPDLASHIHVRVVLVQRIINQVARTAGANAP